MTKESFVVHEREKGEEERKKSPPYKHNCAHARELTGRERREEEIWRGRNLLLLLLTHARVGEKGERKESSPPYVHIDNMQIKHENL